MKNIVSACATRALQALRAEVHVLTLTATPIRAHSIWLWEACAIFAHHDAAGGTPRHQDLCH